MHKNGRISRKDHRVLVSAADWDPNCCLRKGSISPGLHLCWDIALQSITAACGRRAASAPERRTAPGKPETSCSTSSIAYIDSMCMPGSESVSCVWSSEWRLSVMLCTWISLSLSLSTCPHVAYCLHLAAVERTAQICGAARTREIIIKK